MKKFLMILTSCALLLALLLSIAACNDKNNTPAPVFRDKTLTAIGLEYDGSNKMEKLRTLDDIYFPEGIFDTRLGMWIYNASTGGWVRTNTEQGKALFDMSKPTFVSTHGMGGGAFADMPELYAAEYNVLAFHWGTYSGEENMNVGSIVNKVWLSDYDWKRGNTTYHGARWQRVVFNNPEKTDWDWGDWEEEDVSDASVIEIFCAYYYDLFKDLASYDASSIHLFGHSYGGMMSIGAANLLITAYKCGLIPSYMLPDMITMLDPFFMQCSEKRIAWLGKDTPAKGNVCEIAYRTVLDCQKLGITVRLHRSAPSVAAYVTMAQLYNMPAVSASYWNLVNNVVYSHLDDASLSLFSSSPQQHNYGWDWFTSYYKGKMLTDAAATKTTEQALCFAMDYDVSYARTGIKYSVDLNGTKDSNDDILTSFYREYGLSEDSSNFENSDVMFNESAEDIAKLTGKAKIAGFVYFDRNGNGKLDERIRDHLSGAKVTIKNAAGETILSVTTGINGYYEIEVLEEGDYTVSVELPYGYVLSTEDASLQASVTIVDGLHQLALNHFGVKKA